MKFLAFLIITFFFSYAPHAYCRNDAACINECQGNKIYLSPDSLEITESSIFILDDFNVPIPVKSLFVDTHGIFTTTDSLLDDQLPTVWNLVWCNTCHAYRSVNINGYCVRCGNRPSKG